MAKYELGIIGGGNMGEAIVRGVVGGGVLPARAIIVSDSAALRREALKASGAAVTSDNAAVAKCPRLLLAVKPQVMHAVLEEIAASVAHDALVISIAAGIRAAAIDRHLGGRARIVRVMPNTPMLAGAGVSAVAAGPRATQADVQWTVKLFGACGSAITVAEDLLDAVTAVSGSGPAYFFYLIEAMIAAAVAEGLDRDVAASLATQTCAGAARLLTQSGKGPQELRAAVTSPGGTTQRAIETLDAAGVQEALIRAVRNAAQRSRELSGQ